MKSILHLTIGHSPFDDRIYYKECTLLGRQYQTLILAYTSDGLLRDMSGKIKSPGVYDRVLVDGFSSYFNNRYARYVERKLLGFHNVLVTSVRISQNRNKDENKSFSERTVKSSRQIGNGQNTIFYYQNNTLS